VRQRAQAAATEARTTRQGMEIIPDDLQARQQHAEHTYTQLEQRAPDDALLAALDALTSEYRQLRADLVKFDRNQKQQVADMSARAAQAHERIARVQTSFQRAAAPSRRAWKNRRTISADGQQQLDELQARQAQLDQQRAAFEAAALPLAERQDRLAQLTRDYATLFGDTTALWQAECPRDYAASISALRAQSSESATSDTSYSSPSSSSTSSSSDYSSDWSSSSSEPSSDGGTW
jgi:exonuclease VII large subunit